MAENICPKKGGKYMKFTVESSRFAECMRKIQPAVGVTKEKKEVTENSVRLTMTKKQKIKEGYIGMAVSFDGKKQSVSLWTLHRQPPRTKPQH